MRNERRHDWRNKPITQARRTHHRPTLQPCNDSAGTQKGAPQQGDAPTRYQRAAYKPSAASVKSHSRSLQMSNIRALTAICHTARSPIRHALAQEKLANNIQNPIHHQGNTLLFQPIPRAHSLARARKMRAHPHKGRARNADRHTIAHKPTHTQPRQRRQYGEIRHSKGKGRAP